MIGDRQSLGIELRDLVALVDLRKGIEGAVEVMRQLKRALDPKNIMNPGKVVAL